MDEKKLLIYFDTFKECDFHIKLLEGKILNKRHNSSKIVDFKKCTNNSLEKDLEYLREKKEEFIDTIMEHKINFLIDDLELRIWYYNLKVMYESDKVISKKKELSK